MAKIRQKLPSLADQCAFLGTRRDTVGFPFAPWAGPNVLTNYSRRVNLYHCVVPLYPVDYGFYHLKGGPRTTLCSLGHRFPLISNLTVTLVLTNHRLSLAYCADQLAVRGICTAPKRKELELIVPKGVQRKACCLVVEVGGGRSPAAERYSNPFMPESVCTRSTLNPKDTLVSHPQIRPSINYAGLLFRPRHL